MRRLVLGIVCIALSCAAQEPAPAGTKADLQSHALSPDPSANSVITIPAETSVSLALTAPVWARTAKAGDSIYSQTDFPVTVNNQMAIPPGTYAEGEIDSLIRPGLFSPHAQIQIHFTKLIFANGYTVVFPGGLNVPTAQPPSAPGSAVPLADDVLAAVANVYVEVTRANDILLDNGAEFEMELQLPLQLDAASVAGAARQTKPLQFSQFKSATLCRPTPGTPGTPGTPDTVIPGTPGTPDTVIPGGAGLPDTVIPGIPATPPTVIPDTPGTPDIPGTVCPGPPVVTENTKAPKYKESMQVSVPARVGGTQLFPGSYEITWTGEGRVANVEIQQNGRIVANARARILTLSRKSPANAISTRSGADGSLALDSLRFPGQNFALYFDQGAH